MTGAAASLLRWSVGSLIMTMRWDGVVAFLVLFLTVCLFESLALVHPPRIRGAGSFLARKNGCLGASLAEVSADMEAQKEEGPEMTKIHENVRGFFQQQSEVPSGIDKSNGALGKLRDEGCSSLCSIKEGKIGLPMGKTEAWRHANIRTIFPSAKYNFNDAFNDDRPESVYEEASRRIDQFIHSDSESACIVFFNGVLSKRLSRMDKLPCNINIDSFSEGTLTGSGGLSSDTSMNKCISSIPDADEKARDSFSSNSLAAVNMANCVDACLVRVGKGEKVDTPIHIINYCSGTSGSVAAVFPRLVINMQEDSSLAIKQTYIGDSPAVGGGKSATDIDGAAVIVGNTNIQLLKGAFLEHSFEQELPGTHRAMEVVNADLYDETSAYKLFVLQSGGKTGRMNAHINMHSPNVNCTLNSVHLTDSRQSHDLHSSIVHSARECNSNQQHRNVIGTRGESIFKGRIRIPKIAQKTESDQLCRSLMLGEKARVVAMPTLEITADDVVCSHGASVTDLDENSLFYLAARGIDRQEARKLLLRGFSLEALDGALMDKKAVNRVVTKTDAMAPESKRRDNQKMVSM